MYGDGKASEKNCEHHREFSFQKQAYSSLFIGGYSLRSDNMSNCDQRPKCRDEENVSFGKNVINGNNVVIYEGTKKGDMSLFKTML